MKKAVIFGVFIFLLSITFIKFFVPLTQAQTTPSLSLTFNPGTGTFKTNTDFTVNTLIQTNQTIETGTIYILFDSSILSDSDITFVPSGTVTTVGPSRFTEVTGGRALVFTFQTKTVKSGNFYPGSVKINAKKAGTLGLSFVSGTVLRASNGSALTITNMQPGSYTITGTTSPIPTCTGIKTSTGTPLNNLLSGRSYTFSGDNCQNAATYQWVYNTGSCNTASFPAVGIGANQTLTMPTYTYAGQTCTFTMGMKACNTAGQCSQYYSQNPVVKYAPPTDTKQWTFNINLSCANGTKPIDATTNTSWSFSSTSGAACQVGPESRGSTRNTTTYSESFASAPSVCAKGTFNIANVARGEPAIFKSASNSNITATSAQAAAGTVNWNIASLPAGSYALNYNFPDSVCPTPSVTPRPSPCNGIGDINDDKIVSEADALLLLRKVAGLETFTPEQTRRADVNGDTKMDSVDALQIRRYIAGLDAIFPTCTTATPTTITSTPEDKCPLKSQGDADCNSKINIQDFLIWKSEFLTQTPQGEAPSFRSNFNNSQGNIDIQDFLVWKTGFLNPNIAH